MPRTTHTQSLMDIPESYSKKYTDQDINQVQVIIDWINEGQDHEPGYQHQRSVTKLAKAANMNDSTLGDILRGKYPSPPTKHIAKAMDAIRMHEQREAEGVHDCPLVETSVFKTVNAACKRAHVRRNFAVVSAFVGTGKTRALKNYAANHSNVYLVEATPDMNASVLISELVTLTNAVVHKTNKYSYGTKAEKMAAIIRTLKDTNSLLIMDEAETVSPATLEYVRRISDKAHIGAVLAGTERLKPLLKDPHGRFGQISSRTGFWPRVIKGITEDDAVALARASFDKKHKLTDEVLDALWQMCDGSARVLVSSLIPGIKDYGLSKGIKLSPELVFRVGQQVLGFTPRRT